MLRLLVTAPGGSDAGHYMYEYSAVRKVRGQMPKHTKYRMPLFQDALILRCLIALLLFSEILKVRCYLEFNILSL